MLDHARHQFGLARRGRDGTCRRDHLEAVERQTGRRPPQLDGPALPAAVEHIWFWFLSLNGGRGGTGFGPLPLSFADIAAWARLCRHHPNPWEVETLKALDDLWLRLAAPEADSDPTPPSLKGYPP